MYSFFLHAQDWNENLFHIRSFHASRRQEPNLDGR
jgi:hypothetical protein